MQQCSTVCVIVTTGIVTGKAVLADDSYRPSRLCFQRGCASNRLIHSFPVHVLPTKKPQKASCHRCVYSFSYIFIFFGLKWFGRHQPSKDLLNERSAGPGTGLGPWPFLKHVLAWLMLSEPLESEILSICWLLARPTIYEKKP